MQPWISLTSWPARTHCQFIPHFSPTRTPGPSQYSFKSPKFVLKGDCPDPSAWLCTWPCWTSRDWHGSTPPDVKVPVDDIPSLYWINGTTQLGVFCNPVEGTLNPISCVTDKDTEYISPSTGPWRHHTLVVPSWALRYCLQLFELHLHSASRNRCDLTRKIRHPEVTLKTKSKARVIYWAEPKQIAWYTSNFILWNCHQFSCDLFSTMRPVNLPTNKIL